MDGEMDASASSIAIIHRSHTLQQNTPSSTATLVQENESFLDRTIEPGPMEEPKSDGVPQDEPVSKVVPTFPNSSKAISAASMPCPESLSQNNSKESVTATRAEYPVGQEISYTGRSHSINKNDHASEESSSGSLKERNLAAWIKTGGHSTLDFEDLGNSKLRLPNDCSIVDEKQTANPDNDGHQDNDEPPAEANAMRLLIVKLPPAIPQIFQNGIEIHLNTKPRAVASPRVEPSRVANAEVLSVGIVDGRSLNIDTVDIPRAAALHYQESRSRTIANVEIKTVESQDVADSTVAHQGLQSISTGDVELRIVESLDLRDPAAAKPDSECLTIAAAELKPNTIKQHDLADVAAAPRLTEDDISSSYEKSERDSKLNQSVKPTSRAQEVGKQRLGISSKSKDKDTSENVEVSARSQDETATATPVPRLTKRQEHYKKFIERKKEARYARKMAREQAALDDSNGMPAPQHHRGSANGSATAKDNHVGSKERYVPPHIRAGSEEFRDRARRFHELHEFPLKNGNTAQSGIEPLVKDSDRKALEASRDDGMDEFESVNKRTKTPDETNQVSAQSVRVRVTGGANGSCGGGKGISDILKDKDGNSRGQRGERFQVGLHSQYGVRSAHDFENDKSFSQTQVKPEVRAGLNCRAGPGQAQAQAPASDHVQHGVHAPSQARSMLHRNERSAASMGEELVDEEEEEEEFVPRERRWKVKRVVAGIDNLNAGHRSYANPTPFPPLPRLRPDSSISSHPPPPLTVHNRHGMNDRQHQDCAFTLHRRLPEGKGTMSVDGLGRTARGPRGKGKSTPSRRRYKYTKATTELTSNAGGRNQGRYHQPFPFAPDQNGQEYYVVPMNNGRRQHPGFQPQPRDSDSYRPIDQGLTSHRRYPPPRTQQFFPPNFTSLDKGSGTITNPPDSITKSNSPAAYGTAMATITSKPGRKDVDNNTPRVQTNSNIHEAKWSQKPSADVAHANSHPHANININASADFTTTANGQAQGDGWVTSRTDYAHQDHCPANMRKNTDHAPRTLNTHSDTGNNTANVSNSPTHSNHTPSRNDGGVLIPAAPPTNRTNNTPSSMNGRFREPGSGSGLGSAPVRVAKKKQRVTPSSAAPLEDDVQTIVPDGTWDASTTTSNANASNSSPLDLRINLKKVHKNRFLDGPRFADGAQAAHSQINQINALLTGHTPPRLKDKTDGQATLWNPTHGSNSHTTASKASRESNGHTTAINPSPPPQYAPAPRAPAQQVPAQPAPASQEPAHHAPVQQVPARPAQAQQAPMTEASVVPSASSNQPDQVQPPKTSAKSNDAGSYLPPHMRTPVPIVPIQTSRKVIPSTNAKQAEANRNTRANKNRHSLETRSSDCANANGSSAKANPPQTSATASVPVNTDVSTAKDKLTEAHPSTLSNADVYTAKGKPAEVNSSALSNAVVSTAKDEPTEANPSTLSHAVVSTAKDEPTEKNPSTLSNANVSSAKDKTREANPIALSNVDVATPKDRSTEVNPGALSNANGDSANCEAAESNLSAVVEDHVSNVRVEFVEPNSNGLLHPDVSNGLFPVPQLSKGKQPNLEAADRVPTPPGSISNVSVNSQTSITERIAMKKETLEFEHPLAGWDGGWGPAPVEWGGRPSFDHRDTRHVKSMHAWLHERAREALHNPSMLNTTDPGFETGEALAAGDVVLGSPIDKKDHETVLPDDDFTKVKYVETAADAMKKHRSKIKVEKEETKLERRLFRQSMREAQASYVLPPNPHTPQANIYIRPAEGRDMKQISEIYNHYIEHSVVVAERSQLTEQQWRARWVDATDSNYAFLVAVQLSAKGGGYNRRTSQETICGFAYADDFGDIGNAWRFTCELQCYVGNWTLRMGIGKSLIDRMLGALDPNYVVRAGARFEGGANFIRYEGGGVRVIHKVVISLPYSAKDEATLKWQKQWLEGFQFEHVATLPGIGRKFDKYVNLAMFMMETGSVIPAGRI